MEHSFEQLVSIMARLRGKDGCPWDRAQSFKTLKAHLLEETYEVLDSIDKAEGGTFEPLKEELGDLLLQVLFLSQLASEAGGFNVKDVVKELNDKLIRRHPHVFGDREAANPEDALANWEKKKRSEKAPDQSVLDGVPPTLPALLRAHRITSKASRVGFDWNDYHGVFDKIDEELGELKEAAGNEDPVECEHELGDLLFSVINLARFLKLNPEESLTKTINKFVERFHHIEKRFREQGKDMAEADLEEMERYWEEAKKI